MDAVQAQSIRRSSSWDTYLAAGLLANQVQFSTVGGLKFQNKIGVR